MEIELPYLLIVVIWYESAIFFQGVEQRWKKIQVLLRICEAGVGRYLESGVRDDVHPAEWVYFVGRSWERRFRCHSNQKVDILSRRRCRLLKAMFCFRNMAISGKWQSMPIDHRGDQLDTRYRDESSSGPFKS